MNNPERNSNALPVPDDYAPPTPGQDLVPDVVKRVKPKGYFDKSALQVDKVASALTRVGPIGRGADGSLWIYEAGVWKADYNDVEVKARLADLLGNLYRPSHRANVCEYLGALRTLPLIESAPICEYINFKNGLLSWRTGEWFLHSEAILSTVQLNVVYAPGAVCEEFLKFLGSVLPDDAIEFAQEMIGYLLYSGNPMEKAFMFMGEGRNGKGVLLTVIETLLGKENVSHVTLQDLGGNRFAAADLFGKTANIAGDLDATMVRDTGKFKGVTGNDRVRGEHKGRQAFDFFPFAKHLFSANVIPSSTDKTTGYLDRWLVIPFPNYFGDNPDVTLKARLTTPEEMSGIAAWGLVGLKRLMDRGRFDPPASMVEAHEEFARVVDPVRAFLQDCADLAPDAVAPLADVHPLYQAWCGSQGRNVDLGKQQFNERVAAIPGIHKTKSNGTRIFRGMSLNCTPTDLYNGLQF